MICRLILFVAALPLLLYPGVLMAGIMGLAAEPSPQANPVAVCVAKAFLWSTLLYPVGYIAAVAISNRSERAGAAIAVLHLTTCVALFAVWLLLEGAK